MLGLGLSTADKKNVDFAEVFSTLGVAFDLRAGPDDSFSIRNTEARIKELLGRIGDVLKSGKLSGREAKGLRSRLSFACSQFTTLWSNISFSDEGPGKVRTIEAPIEAEREYKDPPPDYGFTP